MPIPSEHMKERLSVSFVTAVAAKAGVACRLTTAPEYGTDAHLVRVKKLLNGKFRDTGHMLHVQIKATTTSEIKGNDVVYDMDADDFNKLAEWEGGLAILVLFCLPKNTDDWLCLSEDELVLKKCCYWKKITDSPTTNKSSKRVVIPRTQVFTPETVTNLLEQVRLSQP